MSKRQFIISAVAIPLVVALIGLIPWISEMLSGSSSEPPPADSVVKNHCLRFDGIDDYLEMRNGGHFDLADALTVEMWIRPLSLKKGNRGLIQGTQNQLGQEGARLDNGWVLMFDVQHFWALQVFTDETGSGIGVWADIEEDHWQHLAAVYDGSHVTLYHNGKKSGRREHTGGEVSDYTKILIGTWAPRFKDGGCFHGLIDEVRIWNLSRSEEEIASTMGSKLAAGTEGLIGYWDFDSGKGQTAYGKAGFKQDARLGFSPFGKDTSDPEWVLSDCPID